MDFDKAKGAVEKALDEQGGFLVEFDLKAGNRITVLADHPEGISLGKLGQISRAVEQEFDRDREDFEIEVSSPGVGSPLQVPLQYQMNIGRTVKVQLVSGKEIKAKLEDFDGENLILKWKERVPKEIGKGKRTVEMEKTIPLSDTKSTKVEVSF